MICHPGPDPGSVINSLNAINGRFRTGEGTSSFGMTNVLVLPLSVLTEKHNYTIHFPPPI